MSKHFFLKTIENRNKPIGYPIGWAFFVVLLYTFSKARLITMNCPVISGCDGSSFVLQDRARSTLAMWCALLFQLQVLPTAGSLKNSEIATKLPCQAPIEARKVTSSHLLPCPLPPWRAKSTWSTARCLWRGRESVILRMCARNAGKCHLLVPSKAH